MLELRPGLTPKHLQTKGNLLQRNPDKGTARTCAGRFALGQVRNSKPRWEKAHTQTPDKPRSHQIPWTPPNPATPAILGIPGKQNPRVPRPKTAEKLARRRDPPPPPPRARRQGLAPDRLGGAGLQRRAAAGLAMQPPPGWKRGWKWKSVPKP